MTAPLAPTSLLKNGDATAGPRRTGRTIGWYAAGLGVLAGAAIHFFGYPLEGGAAAVLGFGLLFLASDRYFFPGVIYGPFSFTFLFHMMGFAVGPLWQAHVIGYLEPVERGFVPAQWGAVLGLTSFALFFPLVYEGVCRWLKKKLPELPEEANGRKWEGYTVLLLLISVVVMGYGFVSGVVNRLGGVEVSLGQASLVSLFSAAPQVMFFFLSYSAMKHGRGWKIIWTAALSLYMLFYFLDGGRGAAAYAMLISGLGLVYGGASPRKVILAGLLVAVVFVPFVDIVNTYRVYYSDFSSHISLGERIDGLLQAANEFGNSHSNSLAGSTQTFIGAMTAKSVDRVFLLTPKVIPYAGLEGLENVFYAFIPAVINPNRPVLIDGNALAIRYGGAAPGSRGAYMPAVGDGFRRASWPGVFLLYAFSALIYGALTAVAWMLRGHRVWMAFFVFLFIQSPGIWSSTLLSNFYLLLWTLPRNLFIFWIIQLAQDFLGLRRWIRPRFWLVG